MKLYTHINRLPLNRFQTALCDGDLSVLVQEGEPDAETLQTLWGDLQAQYAEALGDMEYKLCLSLFKEIYRLTLTIQMAEMLINVLQRFYVERFKNELNKVLGVKCVLDVDKPSEYDAELKRCLSRAKGYSIQLDLKTIAYKKLQQKMQSQKAITVEYFASMVNLLEEQFHAPIDEEKTTVFKYVERVRRLEKMIEQNAKRRSWEKG